MSEPNFFLVGAPKAGTTSLYHYLRQHPDIYMSPVKEPCYFSSEVRPENCDPDYRPHMVSLVEQTRQLLHDPMTIPVTDGIVTTWEDYLQLFYAANGQRAIGEASVGYLSSETAAAGIAARIPHAKVLMVLRSPVDRAFSQYQHIVTSGLVRESFRDYVRACLRQGDRGIGPYNPFLEMGFYATQVQRYLDHFSRAQVGIWIYEETRLRQEDFLTQIFRFLDVDESVRPDIGKRYNEPQLPRMLSAGGIVRWARWLRPRRFLPSSLRALARRVVYRPSGSLRMDPADRALMLEFYRPDILKLQGILNRDLSGWLV